MIRETEEGVEHAPHAPSVLGRHLPGAFGLTDLRRRITAVEAERCFCMPDEHTDVPWRGKRASRAARMKALGNSIPVPMLVWIAKRIVDGMAEAS